MICKLNQKVNSVSDAYKTSVFIIKKYTAPGELGTGTFLPLAYENCYMKKT